jgi:hypothetical protein
MNRRSMSRGCSGGQWRKPKARRPLKRPHLLRCADLLGRSEEAFEEILTLHLINSIESMFCSGRNVRAPLLCKVISS